MKSSVLILEVDSGNGEANFFFFVLFSVLLLHIFLQSAIYYLNNI